MREPRLTGAGAQAPGTPRPRGGAPREATDRGLAWVESTVVRVVDRRDSRYIWGSEVSFGNSFPCSPGAPVLPFYMANSVCVWVCVCVCVCVNVH